MKECRSRNGRFSMNHKIGLRGFISGITVLASVCATGQHVDAAEVPPAVLEWAACFSKVQSGETTWDMDRAVVRVDRKGTDPSRTDLSLRFRWPDAWDLQTGRPRAAADAPLARKDPFNERVIYASGEMLQFSGQGSRKWFQRRKSDFDLRQAPEVFFDGAPLLAGKWLHEIGLPQGAAVVTPTDGGTFRIDVPQFRLRAFLSPNPGAGRSTLVLSKIETLTTADKVANKYEFSNFAVPAGFEAAIGFRRRVTLASSHINGMDDMPPIPLEREDFITEAKVVPRFDNSVFAASTEGFQDLATLNKRRLPLVPPQPKQDPTAKPITEPQRQTPH